MTDIADRVTLELERLGVVAVVRVSRATRTLVAVRRRSALVEVAIARRLALVAGDDTVAAIVACVMRQPHAEQRLRASLSVRSEVSGVRGLAPLRHGKHHDLERIATIELAEHLPDVAPVPVGWTAPRPGRALRSIRLGVWDAATGCIRIHGRLDHPLVPAWYLGFVVFHEYLHRIFDPMDKPARGRVHGPAFRKHEQAHPRWAEAMAWQKQWLPEITSADWGRGLPSIAKTPRS